MVIHVFEEPTLVNSVNTEMFYKLKLRIWKDINTVKQFSCTWSKLAFENSLRHSKYYVGSQIYFSQSYIYSVAFHA